MTALVSYPIYYELNIQQGMTIKRTFIVESVFGYGVYLGGFTARAKIRRTKQSSTVLLSLVSPTNITITALSGTVALTITNSVTAAFDFTNAVWDLELISAGGEVTRLLEGPVTLNKEVTR